eukprot:s353_g6.t1
MALSSPTAAAGGAGGSIGLIDTRAIGKLRSFSGKDDDWPAWAFVARGYLNLLDPSYGGMIEAAELSAKHSDIHFAEMSAIAQERAVVLFNLLTQSVDGRALQVLMNVENGSGFQAWKALCETYEPNVGGRHTAMLMGIIGPAWENTKEADLLEALESWEVMVRRYEVQSNETISDAMKVAVLMRHAPSSVRSGLRTASTQVGTDYERAKKFIRDFLQSGQFYGTKGEVKDDGGPAPMDVGALYSQDSKGGKSSKGKDKGKKSTNKGGKFDKGYGSKGKGQDTSKKKFNGECSHCGKWGHKKADCRILAKEKAKRENEKGKGTNAVAAGPSSPSGTTGSTNAVYYWVDPDDGRKPWADEEAEDEFKDRTWVMMVHEVNGVHQGSGSSHVKYLLWDSGSDEHLCRNEFGGDMFTEASNKQLLGISGISLGKLGLKRVRYKILGESGKHVNAETVFAVSDRASKDVLSVGKMAESGFAADLTNPKSPFLSHPNLDFKIPLYLHNNSYYLKVIDDEAVPLTSTSPIEGVVVAPISSQGPGYDWEFAGIDEEEEGMELVPLPDAFAEDEAHARADRPRLHGWSKVEDMRKRLKELDEPIYGDKHTLWTRLKKAEAALRARQAAAQDWQERHGARQQALREGRGDQVEAVPAAALPSEEERARHFITHLPPAPWCEFCVRGHGLDDPHRRRTLEQKLAENHFELDYSFLKTDTSLAEKFEESSDTVLSVVDTGTGMALAFSIPGKNLGIPYVVNVITSFIAQLGYTSVKLRSDNEPVIKKVFRQIAEALRAKKAPGAEGLRIQFEEQPRYSSQSMGSIGAFQKLLREDVLTMRYAVEAEYGITLHTSHNLWPWLVRWCSFLRSRFAVKANQRTAYQDAFDTSYTSQILPFAETVLFKVPISKARRAHNRAVITKGDTTWRQGIFLGRSVTSNEYLLGTEEGAIPARTLRRLADPSRRHNKDLLEKMIGVPWDQGTTIGRPKRKLEALEPAVVPRLIPEESAAEAAETRRAAVPDEPSEVGQVEPASSAGSAPQPAPVEIEDENIFDSIPEDAESVPMDVRLSARRAWSGEVEASPDKRARVGGVHVGALYSPVEDVVVYEDEVEDLHTQGDDDEERKPLTPAELEAGKREEFLKMELYKTYEVVEFKPGMKMLDAVWVNKRKPDGTVRCRYCVREFKRGDPRTDVFAVASSTSTSRVVDVVGVKNGYSYLTGDAENAFWQVPIEEEAYMYPPREWFEEKVHRGDYSLHDQLAWKLLKEWYGRRKAGQSFVEWAAGHLKDIDFQRNIAAPWLFFNSSLGVLVEVHMDDFFATGPTKGLEKFDVEIRKRIKMKTVIHPMRPGEEFSHLKRARHIFEDGIFITPRRKYAEDMLKMLGLEDCNPAPTPHVLGEVNEIGPLSASNVKVFRACVGLALYLSYDRTDIQFSVRELTKYMKSPTEGSMTRLRRLARYLQGTQDYGVWLPRSGDMDKLVVHSDTDWVNCKKTRKSCACGMFTVGGCLLFSYARSLQMICLSSGEAEFNGGVAACSEGLFLKEIFGFIGFPLTMEVLLDSSAARGIFQRQGVGRVRHLEVKSLWVQQALHRKLFSLHAVPSQLNVADFGTKGLSSARFQELRVKLKIGDVEEFSGVEKGRSDEVNALVSGSCTKKALMVALLTLMQNAEGAAAEGPAPVGDSSSSQFYFELMMAFVVLLVIQAVMLGLFVKIYGFIKRGLGYGIKTDVGVQVEINTRVDTVYHLTGRDVFHIDTTCPGLGNRSRPFDTLRICLRCQKSELASGGIDYADQRVKSAVHRFLLQDIAPQLDELGCDQRYLPVASTSHAEDPKINMDLGDRLVIYKPPGWEVDTTPSISPSSSRLLSAFLRDVLQRPQRPLGASHQFGFLHRLDVPSCLVEHRPKENGQVGDLVGLPDKAPSAVLPSGRPSITFLKPVQRLQLKASACSLLVIRIGTGRRHQIRLHMAHIGHPVVQKNGRTFMQVIKRTRTPDGRVREETSEFEMR